MTKLSRGPQENTSSWGTAAVLFCTGLLIIALALLGL